MSQQTHNRNAYVNVTSSFRTVPDNPISNGASDLNAAYDSLPQNKRHKGMPLDDNCPVPTTCAIYTEHPSHASISALTGSDYLPNDANELNMIARTLSEVGKRSCIKTCVKKVLFRRLKFFDRNQHGGYDLQSNSVCSIVIATCNVRSADATPTWWAGIRKLIVSTHTNHRNNVIKTMGLRFRGKSMCINTSYICCKFNARAIGFTDGVNGKIPNFIVSHGTEMDMTKLMTMRRNLVHYVTLINIYAPRIVSTRVWNDQANMKRNCTGNEKLFQNHVLSISDEAFMLLVLINYTATWMQEIQEEHRKVSHVKLN
jgi:hypothetical protein